MRSEPYNSKWATTQMSVVSVVSCNMFKQFSGVGAQVKNKDKREKKQNDWKFRRIKKYGNQEDKKGR